MDPFISAVGIIYIASTHSVQKLSYLSRMKSSNQKRSRLLKKTRLVKVLIIPQMKSEHWG